MMVADTSAIIAVLTKEQEGPLFLDAMVYDGEVLVSTASAVELMIVAMGRGDDIYQDAIQFLKRPFIRLIPLDQAQMRGSYGCLRALWPKAVGIPQVSILAILSLMHWRLATFALAVQRGRF